MDTEQVHQVYRVGGPPGFVQYAVAPPSTPTMIPSMSGQRGANSRWPRA
ncbi:hypothetical protein [Streptomyces sp. NBC_00258]|nr:hypothetical protein [Streptomyces sp. NBC_00258]